LTVAHVGVVALIGGIMGALGLDDGNIDDTKQVRQFVGTPSAKRCSKRIFPTRVTRGFILNSRRTVVKALSVLVKQPAKQVPCLASPTPPSGCQAQDFEIIIAK
jgi:hypothetical protein